MGCLAVKFFAVKLAIFWQIIGTTRNMSIPEFLQELAHITKYKKWQEKDSNFFSSWISLFKFIKVILLVYE